MAEKQSEPPAANPLSVDTIGEIHEKDSLFMRVDMGSATATMESGEVFNLELSTGLNGSPLIRCAETGKWFSITWREILDLAYHRGIHTY